MADHWFNDRFRCLCPCYREGNGNELGDKGSLAWLPWCVQPLGLLHVQPHTLGVWELSAVCSSSALPPTPSSLSFKLTLHFSCLYGLLLFSKVRKDAVFLLHMKSLLVENFQWWATAILLAAWLDLSRWNSDWAIQIKPQSPHWKCGRSWICSTSLIGHKSYKANFSSH